MRGVWRWLLSVSGINQAVDIDAERRVYPRRPFVEVRVVRMDGSLVAGPYHPVNGDTMTILIDEGTRLVATRTEETA